MACCYSRSGLVNLYCASFDQLLFFFHFNQKKSKCKTIQLYTDSKQPLEAVTWYRKSVSLLSVDETKEVPEKTEKHCRILKDLWWEGLEWISVVHDRDKFCAVVRMVMNLQVPWSTEIFLTRRGSNEKNLSQWL